MILAICVVVDESKCLDIPILEFSITSVIFHFDPGVSGYCICCLSAHPGSLQIMSMTFAAVICDTDDPCALNTAYDPESSFTISPRSTTRPLYF